MPKINVYYVNSEHLIIDSSGQDGANGWDQRTDKIDGADGENAESVVLSLSSHKEGIDINILGMGLYTLPPKSYRSKITVKANGGNGGRGGVGEDGQDGEKGQDGTDALTWCSGQRGENGDNGHDGSKGGQGGNGGHAGNVTIKVYEKDKFLVDLVEVEAKGGNQGIGGSGGNGGKGGEGGCEGNGVYWWHELTERYTPGGAAGCSGYDGLQGGSGDNGKMGDAGSFKVEIEKDVLEVLPKELERTSSIESKYEKSFAAAPSLSFEVPIMQLLESQLPMWKTIKNRVEITEVKKESKKQTYSNKNSSLKFFQPIGSSEDVTREASQSLHYAAATGDIDLVKLLLHKKAFVDQRNALGETPLHFAVNTEIIKLLLEFKADPTLKDNMGVYVII